MQTYSDSMYKLKRKYDIKKMYSFKAERTVNKKLIFGLHKIKMDYVV